MKQRSFTHKATRFSTLVLMVVSLFMAIQPVSFALSTQDVVDIKWNRALYDKNDGQECVTGDGTDGPTVLTGRDSQERAWNFFIGKGLSPEQAAGIIGNLIAESGLDPRADNNGNYKGIAQWSTSDRWPRLVTWAQNNGLELYNVDTQLQYLWKEASERDPSNIAGIKEYDDVPHTTWYWGRYFEVAIIGGSTSDTPLTNVQDLEGRTTAAEDVFRRLSGNAIPTDPDTPVDTTSCPDDQSNGGGGLGPIGVGEGGFTDSGEVSGWPSILANSQLSEKAYGDSLEWRGACASIVSRVWRGQDIGFGFSPLYAMTLYNQYPQYVHKNKKPKKGSILLYTGGTQYGHVTIYLGNNKILNDGHITNASTKEEDYLGWADPNDFGWHTQRYPSEAAIRRVLDTYLSWGD